LCKLLLEAYFLLRTLLMSSTCLISTLPSSMLAATLASSSPSYVYLIGASLSLRLVLTAP
jgi:hypothetical protein